MNEVQPFLGALADRLGHEAGRLANPQFVDSSTAVLTWTGESGEEAPLLIGDHNGWTPEPGTPHPDRPGLTYWVIRAMPAARLEYGFVKEGLVFADSANEAVMHNGLWASSVLAMPDYRCHPALEGVQNGAKGSADGTERLVIPSVHLRYEVTVHLDLPAGAGLEEGTDGPDGTSVPLLLFNDGLDYIEFAHSRHVLRWLAEHGDIPPVAAAYVCPPNRHVPAFPNRTTEYGLNPAYAAFLAEELVPAVEQSYPVGGHRRLRATVGDSYGGLCALFTALSHPAVFGGAYSQSGYVGFRSDALFPMAVEKGREIAFCFDVGQYEDIVGMGVLDPAEVNFTQANLRFRQLLVEHGIRHHFELRPQGHTWGFWRDGLLRNLPVLLRAMSTHTPSLH